MITSNSDEDDWDEEWYPVSGWVPLILAEYRMTAARRVLSVLEASIESMIKDVEAEAKDDMEAVQKATDPDIRIYAGEAEEFANDRILAARTELPYLFFGNLIVYLMTTLEATLADCLETASIVLRKPSLGRAPGPKLEGYVRALEGCGIYVDWSDDLWADLRSWRRVRNQIVHSLEMLQVARFGGIEAAIDSVKEVYELIEVAITNIDQAMLALESAPRHEPNPYE